MLAPTPLSLFCAILLCLPLAVIFTLSTPSTETSAVPPGGATASATYDNTSKIIPEPILRPPAMAITSLEKLQTAKENSTAASATIPPPPPPPPPPPRPPIEEDRDDSVLFQLASRVDPNPKPIKKVAFMFLTTSPLPHAPLWELFFSRAAEKHYNIYVHAEPGLNYTPPFSGVFRRRLIPSKPTRRHTATLISAARRLLAHALLHDKSNAMFALLSPSCIPLHSFDFTYRTLIRSRRSFIEILKDEPGARDRWAARGKDAMLPDVGYEDFRVGSQFWVLKRKHARIIVRERRLWSKFNLPCLRDDTCYPEEHYFPTLLNMVDPRGCIPCTLTHVDWTGSRGGHPRMYKVDEVGPDLIRSLRKDRPRYGDEGWGGSNSSVSVRRRHDPFLFARKFSAGSVHRLVMIANDVILKD